MRISPKTLKEELLKFANIKTPLQPHQSRVVEKMRNQAGLVIAHGLGSGKTLTSIAVQDALQTPATVIVPAALMENYNKEREKHLDTDKQPISLESLQNVVRNKKVIPNPLLIVDEAHRLRESNTLSFKLVKSNRDKSDKAILLTGSPFYNHPADIAPLINLVADTKPLPNQRSEFVSRYLKDVDIKPTFYQSLRGIEPGTKTIINPRTKGELSGILNRWVDYHPGSKEEFPDTEKQEYRVPMTKRQLEVYDTIISKAPPWVALKVREGLPPNKQEAKQLNAYLSGARQVANTTAPYVTDEEPESPKIQTAFNNLKKHFEEHPKSKAVVYSNFLDAGIKPYRELLEKDNIPYGEFTGEMKKKERDQIIRDYNSNKTKVLLLSSAGGEGLDLKGTRLMQVLDPHWNEEKLKQVEGRGIRYKSHADLPPEERKVTLQRYLATRPPSTFDKLLGTQPSGSVDEYLSQMSQSKEDLINQFKGLLTVYQIPKQKTKK